MVLILAGTEIWSRATTCFTRFQAKPVGFNKHTLVGFLLQSAVEIGQMQVAQLLFLHFPHAIAELSEMPTIFEMVESHFI